MARSDRAAADRSDASDHRLGIGGNSPPPEFSLAILVEALPGRLASDHEAALAASIGPIAERANAAPEAFATDEDLAAATDIVNDASQAWAEFDALRKREKDPFKTGGETVDDFFRPHLQRLTRIKEVFTDRATKYTRAKRLKAEAEARAERERLERERREAEEQAAIAAEFGDDMSATALQQAAIAAEQRIADVETPATPATVRGVSGGSARAKTEWTFEIEDFSKVDLNALRAFIAPEAIEKALKQMAKTQKHLAKVTGVRFFEDDKAQFSRR